MKDLIDCQEFVAQTTLLGILFKSQNAAVWEPSQWKISNSISIEPEFVESGTIDFFNPTLSVGNGQVAPLTPNPLSLESRRIRLGITSAVLDTSLTFGNTISQKNSNATGKYVGGAGICTGSLQVINPGIGYTPSAADGSFTFTGVALTSITGNGINATADIQVSGGIIQSATIVNGGNGYVSGDVVGVSSLGNTPSGSNLRLSIVSIASTTELILENVQGDFKTGAGSTIQYLNNSLVTVDLNADSEGGVEANLVTVENTGLSFKVNHKKIMGMNFEGNKVIISDAQSDVIPTKLTSPYSIDSTDPISVETASNFGLFENVGVGTTNKVM